MKFVMTLRAQREGAITVGRDLVDPSSATGYPLARWLLKSSIFPALLRSAWYHSRSMQAETKPDEPLRCSFCYKTQEQVDKLISSPPQFPRAYICNECVRACHLMLDDLEPKPKQRKAVTKVLIDWQAEFSAFPPEAKSARDNRRVPFRHPC